MIVFLYFLLEKYAEAIGNVERAIGLSLLVFAAALSRHHQGMVMLHG